MTLADNHCSSPLQRPAGVVLKLIFARPRPTFQHPLLLARGFSFPSGHAMGALLLYGMLAYFALLRLRSWSARSAVVGGVIVLVLLIGVSRMYLGVHFFSNVADGYAAAGVWLSTCITARTGICRHDRHVHRRFGFYKQYGSIKGHPVFESESV